MNSRLPGSPRSLVLGVLALLVASCGASTDSAVPGAQLGGLEFRVVLDEERCGTSCTPVEFESVVQPKAVFWVRDRPDLVLEASDIISITPTRLSAVIPDRPEETVWSGLLVLSANGAAQLRNFQAGLSRQVAILVSYDGSALDLAYPGVLGPMMGVGHFASRDELENQLGTLSTISNGVATEIEVFSPDELERERDSRVLLDRSEKILRRTQEIQRLAAEGKITHSEMIEQLEELIGEDAHPGGRRQYDDERNSRRRD